VATTAGPGADITIDAAGAAGATGAIARAGHGHKIATSASNPVALGVAAPGTSGHAPSRDNHVHPTTGLSLTGHGAADHTNINRSFFIPAKNMTADAGTPGTIGAVPDKTDIIALANAATQGAYFDIAMPSDAITGTVAIQPIWVAETTDGTAHTVRWDMTLRILDHNSNNWTTAGTTVAWTGVSGARTANFGVHESGQVTTGVSPAATDIVRCEVRRIGADALDTYVGVVNLAGVRVVYSADQ
jgi:hypothetical protein